MKRNLSLVDRVSLFFLASLALVLVCYSVVLYGAVRHQLQQQFDEQLLGAFQTLVAAVEVEPDDVKFEPSDHTIALGTEAGQEDVRWAVFDEAGKIVDFSRNLLARSTRDLDLLIYAQSLRAEGNESIEVGSWRVLQKKLTAAAPKPVAERDPLEREALVVTVARSPDDLNANLRRLGLLVVLVPLGVGTIAAVVGRRICRRALQPVREMAEQARAMTTLDASRRLPVPPTQDELAELGSAFNAVLQRLFDSVERQRRFAGDAAHQLRTPLTAVVGQLDVALRRQRSVDEYREALAVAREQAGELSQIVESLLFLARSQSDAGNADRERIPVATWLSEYRTHGSNRPRRDDLRFDFDGLGKDVAVDASPILFRQLLDNLLDNACKYSPPGTPVELTATSRDGRVEIAVTDHGIGIAAEECEAIFRPFYRTEAARQSGRSGTGLGLAIAAEMAATFGGRLTCRSELGQGSCFTLTLPVSPPVTAARPATIVAG